MDILQDIFEDVGLEEASDINPYKQNLIQVIQNKIESYGPTSQEEQELFDQAPESVETPEDLQKFRTGRWY